MCATLALDPGDFAAESFRWWAIPACLSAAVLVAFRDVFTRYVGEGVPPMTVALSSALMVMAYGWVASFWDWQAPTGTQLLFLLTAALLVMGAYLCAVFSVRLGVFAVIGPLRFVALAVSFFFAVTLFREPFDWLGFSGAVLIVGSAIWIMLRQASLDAKS